MGRTTTGRGGRWVARLGFLVPVGVIVNIAVAWACAIWGPVGNPVMTHTRQGPTFAPDDPSVRSLTDPVTVTSRTATPGLGCDFESMSVMSGAAGSDMFTAERDTFTCRAGWPMRSMVGTKGWNITRLTPTLVQPPFTLNVLPSTSGGGGTESRGIPVIPLWFGFAINTFSFAALTALALFGRQAARSRYRKRHNLCIACGYPIVGLTACPECSTAVPGAVA